MAHIVICEELHTALKNKSKSLGLKLQEFTEIILTDGLKNSKITKITKITRK